MAQSDSPSRHEKAIVVLRSGRQYEAATRLDRAWVHCADVRRRITHVGGMVTYRPIGRRSWPVSAVAEVRWP